MIYALEFTPTSKDHIAKLKRTKPAAYKKLVKLLKELIEHPTEGTGRPTLSSDRAGQWSRRITQKHRLVYLIEEERITVLVLSAINHYDDK